jgi:hypothetical protein
MNCTSRFTRSNFRPNVLLILIEAKQGMYIGHGYYARCPAGAHCDPYRPGALCQGFMYGRIDIISIRESYLPAVNRFMRVLHADSGLYGFR